MCEILGMNCAEKTDFSFSFSGFRQRGGKTDKHRDGFGIAFYEGSGLRCFIDTLPAATSPLAEMIAKSEYKYSIKTLNMISHVRYATRGKAGSLANVHPFQREMWGMHFIFAHNGDIPKFSVSKKEKEGQGQEEEEEQEEEVRGGCNMNISDRDSDSNINETLIGNKKNNNHYPYNFNCPLLGKTTLDDIIYTPVGETDSEAMFCAILNALKAEFKSPPPLSIFHKKLQEFCNEIVSGEEEECICNFLMGYVPIQCVIVSFCNLVVYLHSLYFIFFIIITIIVIHYTYLQK